MHCAIWCHLYNLKNVKNTYGEVLLLACNFTKSNTPPWVFFTFFKFRKWYQIAQSITYCDWDSSALWFVQAHDQQNGLCIPSCFFNSCL